jgi:hypothetical protein
VTQQIRSGKFKRFVYNWLMSAVEVISEIKKLPKVQRRKVFQFVDEQLRREEDLRDNEAANRALKEQGGNIPWPEARKRLGWA